jgi:hypothetical protein
MTKSQKPAPTVVPGKNTDSTPFRESRTEGNLAKQPAVPPRPQGEQKPPRFFKVRTDHH